MKSGKYRIVGKGQRTKRRNQSVLALAIVAMDFTHAEGWRIVHITIASG